MCDPKTNKTRTEKKKRHLDWMPECASEEGSADGPQKGAASLEFAVQYGSSEKGLSVGLPRGRRPAARA